MEYWEDLFKCELNVLDTALKNASKEEYQDNELFHPYKSLVQHYKKLLKLTSKVFRISDAQGKELKRRENEIKNLLDNTDQGFLTFGKDLLVNRQYSAECLRIFGKKINGVNILETLGQHAQETNDVFAQVFHTVFMIEDEELRIQQLKRLPNLLFINGSYINVQYRMVCYDEAETDESAVMLILTDVTDKRKVEDQVLFLSYHDNLTSLYNRAYINHVVPQLLTEKNMPLSIIMADMNGLKLTNDVLGHAFGDELIINAANTISSCCRKTDIAARWGGDEFLVLLPGTDSTACNRVCDRIKEMCKNSLVGPIELSLSLGTATMENTHMNFMALLSTAENMMYNRKLLESKSTRKKLMDSMGKSLLSRNSQDPGHIERMQATALRFMELLQKQISIDSIDRKNLILLTKFHDIGKVAIPENILEKTEELTEEEWAVIKSCPEIGFRMAQSIDEPVLAQAILAIAERWDGTGYPRGLQQDQIPIISRIVSIVEAFDVMTHDRPYKRAVSREEALQEMKESSGKQFDPVLTRIFINNIDTIQPKNRP